MKLDVESVRKAVGEAGYTFVSTELFDQDRRIELCLAKGGTTKVFGVRCSKYPGSFDGPETINEAVSIMLQSADDYFGKVKHVRPTRPEALSGE